MSDNIFIHNSAFVDDGAIVGQNSKIWHGAHVTNSAVLGKNCNIGQNCYIAGRMGEGCKIQNNVNVYLGVELGNYVFCGPSMTFTNDLNPRAKYPKHGNYVKTTVEDGVSFGAGVTVVCGIKVGKWAMIGAGCVVTKDVPAYALVYGIPSKHAGWVCECGVKLPNEFDLATCNACYRQYTKIGSIVSQISDPKEAANMLNENAINENVRIRIESTKGYLNNVNTAKKVPNTLIKPEVKNEVFRLSTAKRMND